MMYVDMKPYLEEIAAEPQDKKKRSIFGRFLRAMHKESRKVASQRSQAKINEYKWLKTKDLVEVTGISYSLMNHIRNNERPVPYKSLSRFCKFVADMSCHELLTGEPKPVVVCGVPAAFLDAVYRLQYTENDFLYDLIPKYQDKVRDAVPDGLLLERLHELAESYQKEYMNLIIQFRRRDYTANPEVDSYIIASPYWARGFRGQREFSSSSIAGIALAMNVSCDYLCALDYTQTADAVISRKYYNDRMPSRSGDTKLPIAREIFSLYLRLPVDEQAKLQAEVMAKNILLHCQEGSEPIPPKKMQDALVEKESETRRKQKRAKKRKTAAAEEVVTEAEETEE